MFSVLVRARGESGRDFSGDLWRLVETGRLARGDWQRLEGRLVEPRVETGRDIEGRLVETLVETGRD